MSSHPLLCVQVIILHINSLQLLSALMFMVSASYCTDCFNIDSFTHYQIKIHGMESYLEPHCLFASKT